MHARGIYEDLEIPVKLGCSYGIARDSKNSTIFVQT